jgi:hypothetical protein
MRGKIQLIIAFQSEKLVVSIEYHLKSCGIMVPYQILFG